MKKTNFKYVLFISSFIALAIGINSCKETENPPEPTNEEELITTLKVELKDTLNGQLYSYFFRDTDGEGGNPPTQWDTIKMEPNKFYKVTLKFLNESDPNAIKDVTVEIEAEKMNHLVCFDPVNINAVISKTDTDGTYSVGLLSTWKTGSSSIGSVTISLKHQPGIKNGTCDIGETDVEVKFPVKM